MDTKTYRKITRLFYTTMRASLRVGEGGKSLIQLAPNVANIVTKPKQEMAIKMGNMLEVSNS